MKSYKEGPGSHESFCIKRKSDTPVLWGSVPEVPEGVGPEPEYRSRGRCDRSLGRYPVKDGPVK